MWKRKGLKKKTRVLLKQSYGSMVAVCFLIAMLTSAYSVSTTVFNFQISPGQPETDAAFSVSIPNSEVIIETIDTFLASTNLSRWFDHGASDILALAIDICSNTISVFFTILRSVYAALTGSTGTAFIFSMLGIMISFLYQIFINNILLIGEKRFFLENRNYRKTSISKIFYLYKLRCVLHPAWIMFCRSFFQFLWNLTIIGGIIKHYEYCMIPYILAENPKISRKDAFYLSKQLTNRNKWKLFLLDLSFLGWHVLSFFTLGFLNLLFINPYMTGCKAELYASLRRNYVLSRSPRYEGLNDSYLEHVPSEDELLISKALYDDSQGPYTKISYFAPEQYPVFLFSVQPPQKAVHSPMKASRKYDVYTYLFLFHTASLAGWAMETVIHLLRDGSPAQDSFILAPWVILYGLYGIFILLISRHLEKNPVFVFLTNLVIYSILEFAINLIYEQLSGAPLRNYSEFLLNFDGRIYLGGSVSYALLGCAFLYYLAPRWTESYMKLGRSRRIFLSVLLCILFALSLLLRYVLL